ncbi:hypothetical protein STRTUCAR8_04119 [Streptomyces turgidiscabies Car8]|uniref:Uncharacterized protein n=1 Tax=Streptomyces turgidiscabies (strain Car8) TaxID=698760 RepID=L7F7C6_STRT8|nr:hypothetical protein STRTUCAR8_04119 [Streptomyces turgidiscabies Car8]
MPADLDFPGRRALSFRAESLLAPQADVPFAMLRYGTFHASRPPATVS